MIGAAKKVEATSKVEAKAAADATKARSSAKARPRRTQAARSSDARQRLLQATIDVLIDRGYNGLTTKEVSQRAGFSNGALVHHYRTKEDLVVAATAAVYEESLRRGRASAESARGRRDPLEGFINDSRSVYFDWPFLAALEILMVARSDPALMAQIQPVMERYRRETNDVWLAAFAARGVPKAQALEAMLLSLNLIRGMAVNSLWQNNPRLYADLLNRWKAHIAPSLETNPKPKPAARTKSRRSP